MTLNDRADNGLPQLPGGISRDTGVVHGSGAARRNQGEQRKAGTPTRGMALARGAGWCCAAGLCAAWATPITVLLGAYGVALATAEGARRERVVCAACLVVSEVVGGLAAWALLGLEAGLLEGLLSGLVPCLLAFAIGLLATSGRTRFEWLSGCALVTGALLAAHAQYGALAQGMTVEAQFQGLLDGVVSQATSLSQTATLVRIRAFVGMLWPAFYVGEGFVDTVVGVVGARMALGSVRRGSTSRLAELDVPLWVLTVLLVGIGCLIAAGLLPVASGVLTPLGWNVIMVVRYAFAAQGLSVLEWVLERHHVSTALRTIAVVCLAYVELSFFVMSIVGIIDVWANFRHLGRGSAPAQDASDGRKV